MCFNGTFGSICDVNWDVEDATALCRNEFGGQFGKHSMYSPELLLNYFV